MARPKKKHDPKKQHGDNNNAQKNKEWAANYGWSLAFLKSHPMLEKIFNEAIDQNWSPARFIAEVQDTQWFKNHADTFRQAEYLQKTDPGTFRQRLKQIQGQIKDAAGALGIEVTPKLLEQWANQAIRYGWTDVQINNHLATQVKIMGKHSEVGGQLAQTQEALQRWAADNGVTINQRTMQNWLRAVVRGDSTFEEYKQYITKMAVAAHPNWSKELQSGMSLSDIAEPYKNTMAQLLELDPQQIDLNDRTLRMALSGKDEKGNYHAMSMYDFQDALRKDPRWQKTDNAKEQYMNTGSSILKMFGLSA